MYLKAYLIWQFIKWNKKNYIYFLLFCNIHWDSLHLLSFHFFMQNAIPCTYDEHETTASISHSFVLFFYLLTYSWSSCYFYLFHVVVCVWVCFYFYFSIRKTHTKQSNQPIWIICIVFSGIILPFSHEFHTTNAYI